MNVKIPEFDGEELEVVNDPSDENVCFKTPNIEEEYMVSDSFIRNLHDVR